jgi:CheY-like chemotaxis protein
MTKGMLFLIDWDVACAEARADGLRELGFRVDVESSNGGRAFRRVRTSVPDVIVVDLRKKASHGREVARALRDLRVTREVPMVFLEAEDQRELTRAKIADARFATAETLEHALEQAIEERSLRAAGPASTRTRAAAE